MRVLLDTNVLAIGMAEYEMGSVRPAAQIWRRWGTRQFDLLVSEYLLRELAIAFGNAWFQDRLPPARAQQLQVELRAQAIFINIVDEVHGVASHWQDDLVLAAAVSGNADYLVTRDKEFRKVDEYSGVRIRTPDEFLIELDAPSDRASI